MEDYLQSTLLERLETAVTGWIGVIGIGIDVFGVAVILIGSALATLRFLRSGKDRANGAGRFREYKIHLGQALLLGLEILVAADIVRTIALEPNFTSLGVLGLLVIIRTFLSWALVLEVEGRWPWQPEHEFVAGEADLPFEKLTARAAPALSGELTAGDS